MAKLFKTISLEDRWRASNYFREPEKPGPVSQGSTELKLTPQAGDKPSILLKQFLTTKKAEGIREPVPYRTDPQSRYAIPFTNTKFRSAISLRDRLEQSQLGTTSHLAQYFLADLYTGYITISPFGIFNHTSDIVIAPFSFTPTQGGTNPTTITFDPATSQGMIFSNGIYTSFVNVASPNYDTLLLQGAIFSNGVYTSQILPQLSLGPDFYIQNPGINPALPLSVEGMVILQGAYINFQNQTVGPVDPTIPTPVLPIQIPSSIVLTTPTTNIQQGGQDPLIPILNIQQGGENPIPITFQPSIQSPVLNVLKYEAQRALAFFTPRIIHGSVDIQTNLTTRLPYKWDSIDAYRSKILGILLSDSEDDLLLGAGLLGRGYSFDFGDDSRYAYAKSYTITQDLDQEFASSNPPGKSPIYSGVEFIKKGKVYVSNPNSEVALYLGDNVTTDQLSEFTEKRLNNPVNTDVSVVDLKQRNTPGGGSLSVYATLAYDQIKKRANDKSEGKVLNDFRKGLRIGTVNLPSSDYTKTEKTTKERGVKPGDRFYENDFVKFRVKSLRDGVTTYFRAFLTSFSDSYNVGWNDVNYVGRQDTLKAFKGSTRSANVAFKMVALNKQDLEFNYFKLNELVKSAAVGSSTSESYFISGPLCEITIGNYFNKTPCVFSSIKYDIQTTEYAWDIDEQVPQLIGVSLDFTILGDVNGTPLNANQNTFIKFKGK